MKRVTVEMIMNDGEKTDSAPVNLYINNRLIELTTDNFMIDDDGSMRIDAPEFSKI